MTKVSFNRFKYFNTVAEDIPMVVDIEETFNDKTNE